MGLALHADHLCIFAVVDAEGDAAESAQTQREAPYNSHEAYFFTRNGPGFTTTGAATACVAFFIVLDHENLLRLLLGWGLGVVDWLRSHHHGLRGHHWLSVHWLSVHWED